ncbi:hypothetical protein D3C76_1599480 [compost metagenome]
MRVASSTPAMLSSTAAVQPVRSLPAVQWNSAAPSAAASSLNSTANWPRMPASLTKARLVSCIIARACSALLKEMLVMLEPDVVLPMMSILV